MSQWTQLKIKCNTRDLDTVCAVMSVIDCGLMIEDPSVVDEVKTCYGELIDEKILNADRTAGAVSIFVPAEKSVEDCLAFIESRLSGILHETLLTGMDEEDWANSWKQYYKPVRIGKRLIVVPTWEDYSPLPDDIVISMDPGMAFGTGTHETTRLCASLLEDRMRLGDTVLDIGTGSGILAVCASKLGASEVTATDIDPVAVRVARSNVAENGCSNVSCIVSDLLSAVEGKYDFICANIVADIVVRLAPDVTRVMNEGAVIAVSGIIDTQSERVAAALTAAGLKHAETRHENDWAAMLFAKLG